VIVTILIALGGLRLFFLCAMVCRPSLPSVSDLLLDRGHDLNEGDRV